MCYENNPWAKGIEDEFGTLKTCIITYYIIQHTTRFAMVITENDTIGKYGFQFCVHPIITKYIETRLK